jgi:uncharacterized protein (DUF2267 family)
MHDFDAALQKANEWIHAMSAELDEEDTRRGYVALRAGLHALRDRLGVVEAVQLGAQLPLVIRGVYYEAWNPSGKPLRVRHAEEFVALVHRYLPAGVPLDGRAVIRALFRLLNHRLSPGESEAVRHVLPKDIAHLWAAAAGPA